MGAVPRAMLLGVPIVALRLDRAGWFKYGNMEVTSTRGTLCEA